MGLFRHPWLCPKKIEGHDHMVKVDTTLEKEEEEKEKDDDGDVDDDDYEKKDMMTSSNGNIFRVTGPLCGTNASDAELWYFLWSAPG